jgi:hypothetical protein
MHHDDQETWLRNELHAELDTLPFALDASAVRERLTSGSLERQRWVGHARRLALATLGALTVLVAIVVTTVWLRLLPTIAPQPGSRLHSAPPPHLLLVRELPSTSDSTAGDSIPPAEGRLVDPVTLKPVAGAPAISLGRIYQTALSHDGRRAAVIRWPGENPYNAELVLVNLASGEETPTGLRLNGDVPVMAFSPDDRSLVWLEGERGPATASYHLVRFAIGGSAQPSTALPADYWPMQARVLTDGAFAVFAAKASGNEASPAAPHVIVFAPDGSVRVDLQLTGVLAGEHLQSDGRIAIDNPGLAWDLSRARLYVVQPGADVVSAVDLTAGRILARVDAGAQAHGWLDAFGVGVAAAKLEPGNDRSAALSPDGTRLYAVGGTRRVAGTGDAMKFSQTPTGGFVLDTRTFTRVASIDLGVDRVLATPSGTLIFSGTTIDLSTEEDADRSTRTELITTDASLRVSAQRTLAGHHWLIGLSPDGLNAYVEMGRSVAVLSLPALTDVATGAGYWIDPTLR